MTWREEARVGVGSDRSSEQKDEGLGFVNFIVDPAARLLDSQCAPLIFS